MAKATSINVTESAKHYKFEYLNLIQGNISRMAGNSALMKGFAATILAAMLGMWLADNVKWYYIVVAFIPVLAFIRLDIYYLQLEKRYRNLYELVAEGKIGEHNFSLNLKGQTLSKHKELINKDSGFFKTLVSTSIWAFYIWFLVLVVVMIVLIA